VPFSFNLLQVLLEFGNFEHFFIGLKPVLGLEEGYFVAEDYCFIDKLLFLYLKLVFLPLENIINLLLLPI
jgi:hypothetical protein